MDRDAELALNKEIHRFRIRQWFDSLIDIESYLEKNENKWLKDLYVLFLFQLLTEGKEYVEQELESPTERKSLSLICINSFISKIRSELTDQEFYYLEYRRHNICHIFQHGYERIQPNGEIRENRKMKNRNGTETIKSRSVIEQELSSLLLKYDSDDGILEKHIIDKLHPTFVSFRLIIHT